jgi:dihydrofolate reductase
MYLSLSYNHLRKKLYTKLLMKAIVCMNSNRGIGLKNRIPWRCKEDLAFFRETTIGNGNNAVVMGRKTFDSLQGRPLQKRRNYVLTKNPDIGHYFGGDVVFESSFENILLLTSIFDEVYIIGGQEIYALFEPYIQELYVTVIKNKVVCDSYFPINLNKFDLVEEVFRDTRDNGQICFSCYLRIPKQNDENSTKIENQ